MSNICSLKGMSIRVLLLFWFFFVVVLDLLRDFVFCVFFRFSGLKLTDNQSFMITALIHFRFKLKMKTAFTMKLFYSSNQFSTVTI
jgi:hypothetical protein